MVGFRLGGLDTRTIAGASSLNRVLGALGWANGVLSAPR